MSLKTILTTLLVLVFLVSCSDSKNENDAVDFFSNFRASEKSDAAKEKKPDKKPPVVVSSEDEAKAPEIKIIGYEENSFIIGLKPEKNSVKDTEKLQKALNKHMDKDYEIKRIHKLEKLVEIKDRKNDKVKKEKVNVTEELYDILSKKEKRLFASYKVKVQKEKKIKIDKLLKKLKKESDIEYTQKNYLYQYEMEPNDPYYVDGTLWGLNLTSTNIAWDTSLGNDIIVATLDTGVDYNHPDLIDNMWDDGNGFCGYDFSDGDDDPMDYHSHGTHVAGIIAAIGNNSMGIIGVSPEVKLMAVKIFPDAYSDVIAEGMRYAADNGANVINNSWGPSLRRPDDPLVNDSIDYAYSLGSTIVFSAGNADDDAQYYFGANHPDTICVASVDSDLIKAETSNWGTVVDIAAPGVNIFSLQPGGLYQYMSGTSMAAPHVSGLAALILATNPALTSSDVRLAITDTSTPLDEPLFYDAGFMNSELGVAWAAPPPPDPPVILDVPAVDEGEDIYVYGENFDEEFAMVRITGNGVNDYMTIISRTIDTIQSVNDYIFGIYEVQVCNGESCSDPASLTINYVEPSEAPVVSKIPDIEIMQDIAIYGNTFVVDKLSVEISGNGITENAPITFSCPTAIKVENIYDPGDYIATVFNNNTTSQSVQFTIWDEGMLPDPAYTTINGSNFYFEWLNGNYLNNIINGYGGIDYIFGRAGDDILYGGSSSDYYIYGQGDGLDVIEDESGIDTVVLMGFDPDDVTYVQEGNDYIIYIPDGSIRIINQFAGTPIEFIGYW